MGRQLHQLPACVASVPGRAYRSQPPQAGIPSQARAGEDQVQENKCIIKELFRILRDAICFRNLIELTKILILC